MAGVFSYSDIDSIPEELIKVEFEKDKKTGDTVGFKKPAKKKWAVEHNGMKFEVASKVQKTLNAIWSDRYETYDEEDDENFDGEEYKEKYYDPSTLLNMCKEYNIPADGYTHEGTGIFVDNPISALFATSAGFIEKKSVDINLESYSLDEAVVDKRIRAFVHILMRCHDEDVVKEIVARATKKKNGSLHKGRLQTIAHMNLVDEDGNAYVVVAKNDSDTKISLEVRQKGVNTTWLSDPDLYTSTSLFFGE